VQLSNRPATDVRDHDVEFGRAPDVRHVSDRDKPRSESA